MVTPTFYRLVFLLSALNAASGYNFDQLVNLTGVFEKCASGGALNASSPCVCMNTVPAASGDKDPRHQVIAQTCLSCRTRGSCSVASCRKLMSCSSKRGCKRLCLCACPNQTTGDGGRVYIPCDEWCSWRPSCRAAVCTSVFSFKLSTTGMIIGVMVIAVCFLSRIFQKLRRKRIAIRRSSQLAEAAASPRASVETLQMPAMYQDPQQSMPPPSPYPTPAPPYSTLPPPGAAVPIRNVTSQAASTSQIDAPPDYETVMSQGDTYRTQPPKYS